MLNPGQPFPNFELPNQDGNPVRLSSFRGRRLILFAFPKANTPGCTTQACGFRDEFPKIEAGDTAVLGVSPDSPGDLRAWKDSQGFPYDLLSDPEHTLLDALGAWGERSMYGKKYMGVARTTYLIGPDGKVAKRWDNVKVDGHAEEVLEAVQTL